MADKVDFMGTEKEVRAAYPDKQWVGRGTGQKDEKGDEIFEFTFVR